MNDTDNDDDDAYDLVRCEDCGHTVSGELYSCPNDVLRCRHCFDRAADAYIAAEDRKVRK